MRTAQYQAAPANEKGPYEVAAGQQDHHHQRMTPGLRKWQMTLDKVPNTETCDSKGRAMNTAPGRIRPGEVHTGSGAQGSGIPVPWSQQAGRHTILV